MSRRFCMLVLAAILAVQGLYAQPNNDIQARMARGYELFEAGSYRAAQQELSRVREEIPADRRGDLVRIDYLLAECAGKLGEENAMEQFRAFLKNYPNSIYTNDVRFAIANLLYENQEYSQAQKEFLAVNPFELPALRRDEYNFKKGYCLFDQEDYDQAYAIFRQVSEQSGYGPHARYYMAYTDYINENYGAAKKVFLELMHNEAYARIIPFYLLQIEFLEGNYDYVTAEGDALLAAATGEREAEIARVLGEAWFHKNDYERTIAYLDRYREAGGVMGREENYLKGFSQYMLGDYTGAVASLSLVCGPDDRLTQNAAYHLGDCYLKTGDKRNAMLSFSMASGADFDDVIREDALFNYGKLQYELGSGVFNEAINVLNRYIREYPSSPRLDQAQEYLVAAYYNSRNYEAAYEAIRQMPNPDNNIRAALQKITYFRALEYFNDGDYDTAYELLEQSQANRFNAKYTALAQFWMGEILFLKGDYARAIPLYREYLSLSPASEAEHTMAMYNLGYCYFNRQEWANARTWFDRFLAAYAPLDDGYRADALNRLGDVNYVSREFRKALENYEGAARLGGDERYYSQYQRAVTLGLLGSRDRKIAALQAIVADGKGDYVDDALYELGRTYVSMERFTDGAATLKKFVTTYPASDKYAAALSNLGLIYQNLGDNAAALRYYQMIVDKAPTSPEAKDALLAIKGIYVDMNDVDGYFAYARKSGIETDLSVVARDSLAYVSAQKVYLSGSVVKSAEALEEYLAKYPRGAYRADALYSLADVRLRSGDRAAAIAALQELSGLYYNSHTVSGLEKLASLCFEEKRYGEAAAAYRKLAATAVNPSTVSGAWDGYLRSMEATEDSGQLAMAVDTVLDASGVSEEVVRRARSLKAGMLAKQGDKAGALALYRQLATEVQTPEGAEATYYVIESQYESGELDAAEKAVLAFAEQNTPQTYWLGRAFLILGDVYVKKGDTFQARATLQSIVDGYSPADDGVVEAARERIEKLK